MRRILHVFLAAATAALSFTNASAQENDPTPADTVDILSDTTLLPPP